VELSSCCGCIVGVRPDGVIEEVIEFPCVNSTSCRFDGMICEHWM
jgi:hypothetical protein